MRKASAAKDATDLSAEYRGLYGFAHIGVEVIRTGRKAMQVPLRGEPVCNLAFFASPRGAVLSYK
jgi:hypothetical protein